MLRAQWKRCGVILANMEPHLIRPPVLNVKLAIIAHSETWSLIRRREYVRRVTNALPSFLPSLCHVPLANIKMQLRRMAHPARNALLVNSALSQALSHRSYALTNFTAQRRRQYQFAALMVKFANLQRL